MSASTSQQRDEKSSDPDAVPDKIKVSLGDIGPALARAAAANGRTLSAEIRARLVATLASESTKDHPAKK